MNNNMKLCFLKNYYRYIPIRDAYIIKEKGVEVLVEKKIKQELISLKARFEGVGYKMFPLGSIEYTMSNEYVQVFIVRELDENPDYVWDSFLMKNIYLNRGKLQKMNKMEKSG